MVVLRTTVYNLAGMDPCLVSVPSLTYVAAHAACTADTPVTGMVSQASCINDVPQFPAPQ